MNALPLLTAALLSAGLLARAEDWPQWGGNDPGRNFFSPAKGLPDRFEPGKLKTGTEEIDLATTKGVKWAVKLGSQSYGNPVVAGGKVDFRTMAVLIHLMNRRFVMAIRAVMAGKQEGERRHIMSEGDRLVG